MKKCPFCEEDIKEEIMICEFCGESLKNISNNIELTKFKLADETRFVENNLRIYFNVNLLPQTITKNKIKNFEKYNNKAKYLKNSVIDKIFLDFKENILLNFQGNIFLVGYFKIIFLIVLGISLFIQLPFNGLFLILKFLILIFFWWLYKYVILSSITLFASFIDLLYEYNISTDSYEQVNGYGNYNSYFGGFLWIILIFIFINILFIFNYIKGNLIIFSAMMMIFLVIRSAISSIEDFKLSNINTFKSGNDFYVLKNHFWLNEIKICIIALIPFAINTCLKHLS